MTYLVISDEEGYPLEIMREKPTGRLVDDELRNRGKNHVRLDGQLGVMGWVSDTGLVSPDVFKRNVVASCLVQALGGQPQPLAGPLVITGYEYPKPGEEEWGYPEPMSEPQLRVVAGIYVNVLIALALPVPVTLEKYRVEQLRDLQWEEQVRKDAAVFRDAEAPGLTIGGVAGQHTPGSAVSAIMEMMRGTADRTGAPMPAVIVFGHGPTKPPYGSAERAAYDRAAETILTVTTRNPHLLNETIAGLPGVDAAVVADSFDEAAGTCKVRVARGLVFLKFAMQRQGYGEVVAEEPEGD